MTCAIEELRSPRVSKRQPVRAGVFCSKSDELRQARLVAVKRKRILARPVIHSSALGVRTEIERTVSGARNFSAEGSAASTIAARNGRVSREPLAEVTEF